jgi:hypothetical protein
VPAHLTCIKAVGAPSAHHGAQQPGSRAMPFMLIILAALIGITVWAFFHTNPAGVDARALLICNVIVLALSVPVAIGIGAWLYADAVVVKSGQKGMATFLAIMASGTAALLVVAIGGGIRNFIVFPRSRRASAPVAGLSGEG